MSRPSLLPLVALALGLAACARAERIDGTSDAPAPRAARPAEPSSAPGAATLWATSDAPCILTSGGRELARLAPRQLTTLELAPGTWEFVCSPLGEAAEELGAWQGRAFLSLRHPASLRVRLDVTSDWRSLGEPLLDEAERTFERAEVDRARKNGMWADAESGLAWTTQVGPGKRSWADASAFCSGLRLGGFDNWRMPSRDEMVELFAAERDFQESPLESRFESLWVATRSSTQEARALVYVPGLDFRDAEIVAVAFSTRCVRRLDGTRPAGAPFPPSEIAEADAEAAAKRARTAELAAGEAEYRRRERDAESRGVVFDETTGLSWTTADSGADIGWSAAAAYCRDLTAGGFDDWRLPDLDELEGIYVFWQPDLDRYRDRNNLRLPIRLTNSRVWGLPGAQERDRARDSSVAWVYDFAGCSHRYPDCNRFGEGWIAGSSSGHRVICARP